jgi:hypothetical protein
MACSHLNEEKMVIPSEIKTWAKDEASSIEEYTGPVASFIKIKEVEKIQWM